MRFRSKLDLNFEFCISHLRSYRSLAVVVLFSRAIFSAMFSSSFIVLILGNFCPYCLCICIDTGSLDEVMIHAGAAKSNFVLSISSFQQVDIFYMIDMVVCSPACGCDPDMLLPRLSPLSKK